MKNQRAFTLLETVIITAIGLIVITIAIHVANSVGISTNQYTAKVVDKHYKPAHTTTSTTYINNVPNVSVTNHPPSWRIKVLIEDQATWCESSDGVYSQVLINEKVTVTAGQGRIFKSSYVCKGVSL